MLKQTNIQSVIRDNPLMLSKLNDLEIAELEKNCSGKNIFFGLGVMTHDKLSENVPLDILNFFFTAELLKRALKSPKVIVFVAEQHAFSNNLFAKSQIESATNNTIEILTKISKNFALSNFEFIRTSDLQQVASIRKIFASLPDLNNEYLKHEIADVMWLQKFHQVALKLGWAMGASSEVTGHDERFFDQSIRKFCPKVNFLHLKPGRTFDEHRSRVSPYISVANETRILLTKNENVSLKLSNAKEKCPVETFKATKRHLSNIIRLHDKLFDTMKFMNFEDKLQNIINQVTN